MIRGLSFETQSRQGAKTQEETKILPLLAPLRLCAFALKILGNNVLATKREELRHA
ncbi:MAG: hypothetical protein U0359_28840 [Byssovorax sp.]